jgi:tetratricopeptide (TPR) repeat protein
MPRTGNAHEETLDASGRSYARGVEPIAAFEALGLDPGDLPDVSDIEAATVRLRRSYSTTPPADLVSRLDERLRQVRHLLAGRARPSWRSTLMESAGWMALLRGTAQADLRQWEAAETSVRAARVMAQEIGQRDLEAWSWETQAWLAVVFKRYAEARELAGVGAGIAPVGSHGLVAALGQRARIDGLMGDLEAAEQDLSAVERAMAQAGEPEYVDDHYSIDEPKSRYFGSGAMAALGRPREAIAYAAEVVSANENPKTRNYWPLRVANARMEWAAALADLGEEDEAVAMARLSLDPEWWRPDTEWRARILLSRMRDPRLRADLADLVEERVRGAS